MMTAATSAAGSAHRYQPSHAQEPGRSSVLLLEHLVLERRMFSVRALFSAA